ncbi:TIGR03013 family XrtA/PEP-CTERM system glycosyltransferase [Halofilum ochraceum]|uniref:TIGR03013 family XrtA/PEP-CTERM system glycosyltransferase n=1 Tax=Halofilum ochraceum TaxID=1611323 RepID=UPI00082A0F26|nr:TIGR03013 family XrtA/PEP-CTERM system glycosyltransferase [Halofilum ochraceum]
MNKLARYYGRLFDWLPVLEGFLLVGAVYLAVLIRVGTDPSEIRTSIGPVWPEAVVFSAALLVSMTAVGLYNRRLRDGLEGIVVRIVLAFAGGTTLTALIYYAFPQIFLGRGVLFIALALGFLAVLILRAEILGIARYEEGKRRVLVLGAGQRAEVLSRLRRRTDLIGLRIVGYVRHANDRLAVPESELVELDAPLSTWAIDHGIDEIVVGPDERRQNLDMHQLLLCRAHGMVVSDVATFYERETGRVSLDILLPSWLAFSTGFHSSFIGDRVKRLFDIVVSLSLLILASPLILLAALAVWIESGFRGPILYRQARVGTNDTVFQVLKFRSMRPDAEADGTARWATAGDDRVTSVGRILRRYRIDELPQIFNVLRGEMSFVGPRPERPEFVDHLEGIFPRYADRHRVKPGLTGWAQIRYPYGASDRDAFEKLQYDLYYVKNRNLQLDLTILLQTAEVVLWGKGAR